MQAQEAFSTRPQTPFYLPESPVTLRLTVQKTGPLVATGPDADGLVVHETEIETIRYGNTDILAAMQQRGLIPQVNGHALVAVWANWPDADPFQGSCYRFFVRKSGTRSQAVLRVPTDLLALQPQRWLHENNLRITPRHRSGTASYESYSELKVSVSALTGTLLGSDEGGGAFKTPTRRGTLPQYLPTPGALNLSGQILNGVATAQIDFGPARFVPRTDFKPNALPKLTGEGHTFGSIITASTSVNFAFLSIQPVPYVHHFCPVIIETILDRQLTLPTSQPGRQITQIETTTLPHSELLLGALRAQGVSDPAGWAFYLHARSDDYLRPDDFELVLGHPDGRILQIGTPSLSTSLGARSSRNEYLDDKHLSGSEHEQTHTTHDHSWTLANGNRLYLDVTGPGEIVSSYGPISESSEQREVIPVSAAFTLFGTYGQLDTSQISVASGLARVSITIGAPLAQTEIPEGWATRFPPYVSVTPYQSYSGSSSSSSRASVQLINPMWYQNLMEESLRISAQREAITIWRNTLLRSPSVTE